MDSPEEEILLISAAECHLNNHDSQQEDKKPFDPLVADSFGIMGAQIGPAETPQKQCNAQRIVYGPFNREDRRCRRGHEYGGHLDVCRTLYKGLSVPHDQDIDDEGGGHGPVKAPVNTDAKTERTSHPVF